MLTYEQITKSEAVRTYIIRADESLAALGFTEHSFAHVMHVAETAGYILQTLGYDERTVELAKIAGYLHDIGNLVNRKDHSQSGAVMAWSILNDMACDPAETATIVTAIGNHDEGTGVPVNAVSAAMAAVWAVTWPASSKIPLPAFFTLSRKPEAFFVTHMAPTAAPAAAAAGTSVSICSAKSSIPLWAAGRNFSSTGAAT